jgi:hypothetical protein
MAVSEIAYEDERYIVSRSLMIRCGADSKEQPAPPIHEEFPIGERVLFLGQMAYGGAAQVTSTAGGNLGISLAVSFVCVPAEFRLTGSTFHLKDRRTRCSATLSHTDLLATTTPRISSVVDWVSVACSSRRFVRL